MLSNTNDSTPAATCGPASGEGIEGPAASPVIKESTTCEKIKSSKKATSQNKASGKSAPSPLELIQAKIAELETNESVQEEEETLMSRNLCGLALKKLVLTLSL